MRILIMVIIATGGGLVLLVTWLGPKPLPERITPTIIGFIGVIGVLVWTLVLRAKSAKVRTHNIIDKFGIKKGRD